MLSVCIPIYNFDVRSSVKELYNQLIDSKIFFEIILFDDCSDFKFQDENKELQALEYVYYKELATNVGRSKIRNKLAEQAQYDNILFLDCDVIIHDSRFIANYLAEIENGSQVICGGRIYPPFVNDKGRKLRWQYGIKSESKPAVIRKQYPSKSFMTNNFIIKKSIFKTIQFNENLSRYGHEDTLFGYELKQHKIIPEHIENPVLNGDIETDVVFLAKTKEGIINLSRLYDLMKNQEDFVCDITLLAMYERVMLNVLFVKVLGFFENALHKVLCDGIANIMVFNLYKLSVFINCQKHD